MTPNSRDHVLLMSQNDFRELNVRYYNESLAANNSGVDARVSAFDKALKESSGGSGCQLNAAASGT